MSYQWACSSPTMESTHTLRWESTYFPAYHALLQQVTLTKAGCTYIVRARCPVCRLKTPNLKCRFSAWFVIHVNMVCKMICQMQVTRLPKLPPKRYPAELEIKITREWDRRSKMYSGSFVKWCGTRKWGSETFCGRMWTMLHVRIHSFLY